MRPVVNHFITLKQFSPNQILFLIRRSLELKYSISHTIGNNYNYNYDHNLLKGKTLGLIFSKRSTRTRISAESGWARFGGHPLFLGKDDIQLGGGGETLQDTAVVASSMLDAILARVHSHDDIATLAKYASCPVINALSDKFHPLQALADFMTLYEQYGSVDLSSNTGKKSNNQQVEPILPPLPSNLKVAWVGDANNIINSLLVSLPRLGIHVSVATPKEYSISSTDVVDFLKSQPLPPWIISNNPSKTSAIDYVTLTHDPIKAVANANIIVTDTWISMGQEEEKAKRLKEFAGFRVTEELALSGGAHKDWKFMHCLPRKQEEVEDKVFYDTKRSLVFQEAENRKYTVMAVFEVLFKKDSIFWSL